MRTQRSYRLGLVPAALAVALTAGCNESVGVNGELTGAVRVLMQRATSAPAATPDAAPQYGQAVPEDTVSSFKVTVTAVECLQAGASDTSDNSSAWTRLTLSAPIEIDLMALPTESQTALVIASGRVTAGSYTRVRLRVTNPRIRFKGSIDFGLGGILQGGVDYNVIIPSVAEAGLKAAATVTVQSNDGAQADIGLVFDAAASLGTVEVTGTGQVMMSAVLRAS